MDTFHEHNIKGFSKLSRNEKIEHLSKNRNTLISDKILESSRHTDLQTRKIIEDFSENVLTSFHLPLSVAPNFLINGKVYHVPMVIEESSVVAAASSAAKFWSEKGGFRCNVISSEKKGQVHFIWKDKNEILHRLWPKLKPSFIQQLQNITKKMEQRGGGITRIALVDKTTDIEGYYQIDVSFETADAMGANFINTCLEKISDVFREQTNDIDRPPEIIMSILSNYTPNCLVDCTVECSHNQFDKMDGITSYPDFIRRFETAVNISKTDTNRAVTHNKGIFNGIDAVAIATGNDFRAIEAGTNAYAARKGKYTGLTNIKTDNNIFSYTLKLPLALGTVGGVTSLHPEAKWSMQLLGNPDAKTLMTIAASAGLANNFSAIRALITKGIQHGHMKMHLKNILNQLRATESESQKTKQHFKKRIVSYSEVENFINLLR